MLSVSLRNIPISRKQEGAHSQLKESVSSLPQTVLKQTVLTKYRQHGHSATSRTTLTAESKTWFELGFYLESELFEWEGTSKPTQSQPPAMGRA